MVDIIVLGTQVLLNMQQTAIKVLLQKHGLPKLREENVEPTVWNPSAQDSEVVVMCAHYQVDVVLMGALTTPAAKAFLVEVAELPGVYITACPECAKRRHWERQKSSFQMAG